MHGIVVLVFFLEDYSPYIMKVVYKVYFLNFSRFFLQ